jgi:hypothetical protein
VTSAPLNRTRPGWAIPAALSSLALLAGCGGTAPGSPTGAGADATATTAPADIRPATVGVDVPGFTLALPEGTSWETVGLHSGEATELSGAVRGDGDPVELVLVWQKGQRSPDAALDRALADVAGRGVQVTQGEEVVLEAGHDLGPVARRVSLASTTGSVEGLAVVWTCAAPDRTFSMTAYGGSEQEQAVVVDTVLASFACTG